MDRLQDLLVAPPQKARVVVHADSRPPRRGAWNVQVFQGLAGPGHSCDPLFLQRGRFPRLRTALQAPLARLRRGAPLLRHPGRPGHRRSRYQQVNAYGPRWVDLFQDMLDRVEVSRFGHAALNEAEGVEPDPEGPLLWLPTWDSRMHMEGANPSSLEPFVTDVLAVARHIPVLVKLHPLTVRHRQAADAGSRLAAAPGITFAPADTDPYRLLQGARGVLTDTSSLGIEAYCSGFPVAIARNPGVVFHGVLGELAERVPRFSPGDPGLRAWAEAPGHAGDRAWASDLLYAPQRRRNDAFAAQLRSRVAGDA
jgi:hypothetical protein